MEKPDFERKIFVVEVTTGAEFASYCVCTSTGVPMYCSSNFTDCCDYINSHLSK